MLPPRPLNDRSVMRSWNIFIPVNRAGVFIWARSTEIPATEISVNRAGPVLIWTHRNFYKGNSTKEIVGSRLTGLIWTGPMYADTHFADTSKGWKAEWTLVGTKVTQSSTPDEAEDWTWDFRLGRQRSYHCANPSAILLLALRSTYVSWRF